jgi:lysophospholipase L1-like esterase
MLIAKNSKLVMIGDSITDAGRAQPAGEGLFDALGKGYVPQIDALIGAAYSGAYPIRIVNKGTSGHTTRDLKARWQADVIDQKPDWVSIMIGANDVWRQFDVPLQKEWHVYPDEYEANLEELVTQTKAAGIKLILMTPFYIEPNRADAMRAQMDRYGDIVKRLAAKHDAILVDVQAAFDEALANYYPATLGWDRIHPTQTGYMIITRAVLQAIGFEW